MKLKTLILVAALALTTTNAMAAREVKTKDFSGWMDDYDSLVFHEERNAYIFFNEEKRGKYQKVLLESVSIFSENSDGEESIARKASDYLESGVKQLLAERNMRASEPGPGVLRLAIAITGVEKSKEDLKVYNFVPVAAVFRGAQAATGNVSTYIDTMFEAEMVDSVSSERLGAIVAKSIEETEKRSGDDLTFDDIVPTLDKWLAQFGETLDGYLGKEN